MHDKMESFEDLVNMAKNLAVRSFLAPLSLCIIKLLTHPSRQSPILPVTHLPPHIDDDYIDPNTNSRLLAIPYTVREMIYLEVLDWVSLELHLHVANTHSCANPPSQYHLDLARICVGRRPDDRDSEFFIGNIGRYRTPSNQRNPDATARLMRKVHKRLKKMPTGAALANILRYPTFLNLMSSCKQIYLEVSKLFWIHTPFNCTFWLDTAYNGRIDPDCIAYSLDRPFANTTVSDGVRKLYIHFQSPRYRLLLDLLRKERKDTDLMATLADEGHASSFPEGDITEDKIPENEVSNDELFNDEIEGFDSHSHHESPVIVDLLEKVKEEIRIVLADLSNITHVTVFVDSISGEDDITFLKDSLLLDEVLNALVHHRPHLRSVELKGSPGAVFGEVIEAWHARFAGTEVHFSGKVLEDTAEDPNPCVCFAELHTCWQRAGKEAPVPSFRASEDDEKALDQASWLEQLGIKEVNDLTTFVCNPLPCLYCLLLLIDYRACGQSYRK